MAGAAQADDFGTRHDSRAFWLKNQSWPNPREQVDKRPAPRWTMTYTAGIARRFGMEGGHADFFQRQLGGEGGPGLVGTVDNGAAKLELRWHTGE